MECKRSKDFESRISGVLPLLSIFHIILSTKESLVTCFYRDLSINKDKHTEQMGQTN